MNSLNCYIAIYFTAVVVLVAGKPHDELQCMNHKCHHEEVEYINQ